MYVLHILHEISTNIGNSQIGTSHIVKVDISLSLPPSQVSALRILYFTNKFRIGTVPPLPALTWSTLPIQNQIPYKCSYRVFGQVLL